MKNIIVYVFVALHTFACGSLVGYSNQERFLQANKEYERKAFDKALALYQEMSVKGSAAWYNMGNCWYQQGDYAQARVCWLRAKRSAPWHERSAIDHNIHLVQEKSGEPECRSWYAIVAQGADLFSLLLIQLLILVSLYCVAYGFWRWRSSSRGAHVATIFMTLFLLILTVLFSIVWREQSRKRAVVTDSQAKLFAGPDTQFHERAVIGYAREVTIDQEHDGWYRVRAYDMSGWLPQASVVRV